MQKHHLYLKVIQIHPFEKSHTASESSVRVEQVPTGDCPNSAFTPS